MHSGPKIGKICMFYMQCAVMITSMAKINIFMEFFLHSSDPFEANTFFTFSKNNESSVVTLNSTSFWILAHCAGLPSASKWCHATKLENSFWIVLLEYFLVLPDMSFTVSHYSDALHSAQFHITQSVSLFGASLKNFMKNEFLFSSV